MQVIKDWKIIQDHWVHLADEPITNDGFITVSIARWKTERSDLISRNGELGLRVTADDNLEEIADDLEHFQIIALDFPAFTDGRCFSYARLLRNRYQFSGEIRAIGAFIRDQIFFLSRVGVDSFEFKNPINLNEALKAAKDFTVCYQTSSDEREPYLFHGA